jgi:hypothetical protein
MSSLSELEQDVFQFLSTLAHVCKVDVDATAQRGKKRLKVVTYVDRDTCENRVRVRTTEEILRERHKSVAFDFTCATLKDEHESTVGTPQIL